MSRSLSGTKDKVTEEPKAKEPKQPSPVESWNKVFALLSEADKAWQEHQKVMSGWREGQEELPPQARRFLTFATNKSKFDVMLERMVRYARNYGGIANLVIKDDRGE